MHITVVMPPTAAAALPLPKSSFCGCPGSRMWTWASTKPGNRSRLRASMTTSADARSLPWRHAAIRPSSISTPPLAIVPVTTLALWMHSDAMARSQLGRKQQVDRACHNLRARDDVLGARILAHVVATAADRRYEQHSRGHAACEHHCIVSRPARQTHGASSHRLRRCLEGMYDTRRHRGRWDSCGALDRHGQSGRERICSRALVDRGLERIKQLVFDVADFDDELRRVWHHVGSARSHRYVADVPHRVGTAPGIQTIEDRNREPQGGRPRLPPQFHWRRTRMIGTPFNGDTESADADDRRDDADWEVPRLQPRALLDMRFEERERAARIEPQNRLGGDRLNRERVTEPATVERLRIGKWLGLCDLANERSRAEERHESSLLVLERDDIDASGGRAQCLDARGSNFECIGDAERAIEPSTLRHRIGVRADENRRRVAGRATEHSAEPV